MPKLAIQPPTISAWDTECGGKDFKHGVQPFFVTRAMPDKNVHWEVDVDPITRMPDWTRDDLLEIQAAIAEGPTVYQNGKFDGHALHTVGVDIFRAPAIYDTLTAGHLLYSNLPHDLTSMAFQYLGDVGVKMKEFEDRLEVCVKECRAIAKKEFGGKLSGYLGPGGTVVAVPKWRIATIGDPMLPSAKGKKKGQKEKGTEEDSVWRCDYWLPRAIAKELDYPKDHIYWRVLAEYSNADSATTLTLWFEMESEIRRRGLWEIYLEKCKAMPSLWRMEEHGVTASIVETNDLKVKFGKTSKECYDRCIALGEGTITKLPKNGRSNELDAVVFGKFGLTHEKKTKTGTAMDKEVLSDWLMELDESTPAHEFIRNLQFYRKRQTALGYIESYERFWLPAGKGFMRLHPTYNATGTVTLRGSMNNPNGQQISKINLEEMGSLEKGKNLRHMFCPADGRELWSMDARNIERRLPAYESKEPKLVEVFEKPDEAPYWGNLYCLTASVLYPGEYWPLANKRDAFKDKYPHLYKQSKFFDLAKQYGCGPAKGDLLSKIGGSFKLVDSQFPLLAELQRHYLSFANKHGYVETIPDREVSDKGYPLLCSRTERGVKPTTPFNYHIQGTACWWMTRAMTKADAQLQAWRAQDGFDGRIVLQVHDEILFDFPAGRGKEPWKTNLQRIRKLKYLMESCSKGIGVPIPVSCEYHVQSWAEGMAA